MNLQPEQFPYAAECLQGLRQSPALSGPETPASTLDAHLSTILGLAAQLQHPPEHVAALYCAELTTLAQAAAVADYLPVLTAKRVRAKLRPAHGQLLFPAE